MQPFLKELLNQIRPDTQIKDTVDTWVQTITQILQQQNINADVCIGGSYAKNTHLKGNHDVDVFVRFDMSYPSAQLSALLQEVLDRAQMQFERIHGSRDYYKIVQGTISFEVVPVHRIEMAHQATNVTDCSPLHISWIKHHTQRIVDDIPLYDHMRLLKAFCRANRVYGAESYIEGFSGHVLDILLVYYGGFNQCITQISNWIAPVIIDPENHYSSPKHIMAAINQAKQHSPLLLVDPVDALRNAASSVRMQTFNRLIQSAKSYIQNPSKQFFELQRFDKDNWRHDAEQVVQLDIYPIDGKHDVIGAKMKKVAYYLLHFAQEHGFKIPDAEFWWDGKGCGRMLLYVPNPSIDKTYLHRGPPTKIAGAAKRFRASYPDALEDKGRLYSKRKREFTDIISCLSKGVSQEYVTNMCEAVQIVPS